MLERDQYEVGRSESNTLSFQDVAGLSRKHFLSSNAAGSAWKVRDLGNTNGTFVNGTRLAAEHALRMNDRVDAGELSIVFIGGPAPTSLPPTR